MALCYLKRAKSNFDIKILHKQSISIMKNEQQICEYKLNRHQFSSLVFLKCEKNKIRS